MTSTPPLDRRTPIVLYADAGVPGGTAGYTVNLARGLRGRGYRVGAIVSGSPTLGGMRDQLTQAGVEVHALEDENLSAVGRLRRLASFTSLLRGYRGGVLALMLGNYVSGGPVILAGALAGLHILRADLQPPMPPFQLWRHRLAFKIKDRLVRRIVVGAIENRDAFVHDTWRRRSQIDVIHTGIVLEPWEPGVRRDEIRERFGYSPQTLVIGTASRLDEERKGIAYFIDMASRLADEFPNAAFLVSGAGSLQPTLEQQAATAGVGDRVTFAGWQSDVPGMLAAMDVFIMPSTFEGGPTSVLEAMAMSKPVVATRVGMVPEVVDDGRTGFVVDIADGNALADAVRKLLYDPQLASTVGQRAREKAVADFSIDRMVERYLDAFAGVVR
jgi:glycosyltransferase involved in cell wall biosynthesis